MDRTKDADIQAILIGAQSIIVKAGLLLTIATLLYETILDKVILGTVTLNISLIALVGVISVIIFALLINGLRADRTNTRELLLKGKENDLIQMWMYSRIMFERYKLKTIAYSVGTILSLASMIVCLIYQDRLFYAMPVIVATIFLSQLAGMAKSANKIPIFPKRYRKELEERVMELELLKRQKEEENNG